MPPTVKRQNPTGDKVSKGGLRDRMIPVGDIRKGMRVCIYGIPKSGKTRIACTFPGKKLILGFEDGTSSVSTSKDTIWLPITSSDEFKEGLTIAVEDKFDSVILDEASGFRMVLLKEQLGLLNVPVQLTWAMAKKQDWGAVAGNFKENVKRLLQAGQYSRQEHDCPLPREQPHQRRRDDPGHPRNDGA